LHRRRPFSPTELDTVVNGGAVVTASIDHRNLHSQQPRFANYSDAVGSAPV
jgi:hypothetical protein